MAVSNSIAVLPDGWASLADKRVAYQRGWKAVEKNLGVGDRVYAVSDPRQMFEMFVRNRVDVIVAEPLMTRLAFKTMGVENFKIIQPPLHTVELLFVVHEKHVLLVPRLEDALRAMKRDGTYDRIYTETLRDFGID